VLEQITIDGRDVTSEELGSIAPGASHLSFTFAGISFAAPQQVQYRYMLQGFDKDWVDAGTRRSAFYTNLAPGRYRFRVSARIAGGPWSQPGAEIGLRLKPHFYQTVFFRIVLLLALAGALFGIYLLRVRALQSRFDAVGAERNRLARDIHDTLAQSFVAVSVRLELMAQLLRKQKLEDCGEQLDQTRTLVREALAEARRSIWDLRAEGTDAMTLPVRLARAVKQTSSDSVTVRFEITGTYRPLDQGVEDELFRITQEAIANAVRHAQAHSIQVSLTYASALAMIEVVDDGCGFDVGQAPAAADGHFGLVGMRERAQRIGATIKLESSLGGGTRIEVEKRLSAQDKTPRKDVTHV
jgi:signal transduction histidine kinase